MQEVLDLGAEKGKGKGVVVTPAVHGSKLVSADMHGAMVEVVRSRCASRVGTKGIVVRDTKFTFLVVAPGDRVTCEYLVSLLLVYGMLMCLSNTQRTYCLSLYCSPAWGGC